MVFYVKIIVLSGSVSENFCHDFRIALYGYFEFLMKGRVVVKIQESAENYLETIHMLSKHKPYVRSIDIANELSFSKPSVSVAMKNLRENGYIHMDDQGHITLTQTGQDIADKMYERQYYAV